MIQISALKNNSTTLNMEDDIIKDDELENEVPEGELDSKKKPLTDDEDVESVEDLAEEELDVEEPYDDVDTM